MTDRLDRMTPFVDGAVMMSLSNSIPHNDAYYVAFFTAYERLFSSLQIRFKCEDTREVHVEVEDCSPLEDWSRLNRRNHA